jgi:hypothetical protein
MRIPILVAACFAVLGALPAKAISGTLSGCVVFTDTRTEGSRAAGSRRTNGESALAPIKTARVLLINGWGGTTGSSTTGSNGCFTISYEDTNQWTFPVTWTFRVELKSPGQFYVTNESGALFVFSQAETLNDSSESVGTVTVSGDKSLVYATAESFFDIVVDASALLTASMTNVRIDAEASGPTSYAADRNWVRIRNLDGRDRPVSGVAHELGHALTMHALDRNFSIPWGCTGTHTYNAPMDCEAPPWHEASANVFATMWQWTENAPDVNATMGRAAFPVGIAPTACLTNANPHRIEACMTAAMWDAWDDPTGDDDGIGPDVANITVSSMALILDQYSNGTGNRQNAEGGSHGNNLWDWLENFDDDFPTLTATMRTIYTSVGLSGVGEEIF